MGIAKYSRANALAKLTLVVAHPTLSILCRGTLRGCQQRAVRSISAMLSRGGKSCRRSRLALPDGSHFAAICWGRRKANSATGKWQCRMRGTAARPPSPSLCVCELISQPARRRKPSVDRAKWGLPCCSLLGSEKLHEWRKKRRPKLYEGQRHILWPTSWLTSVWRS